uniref:ABC transporter domain-containing protein n=1 Tax=Arion vulgaris TaxID=1028688 RepID=A0A0B6ZBZ1_9EUPU
MGVKRGLQKGTYKPNKFTSSSYINMGKISVTEKRPSDDSKVSCMASVLSAHNITYKVVVRNSMFRPKVEKTILSDITAVFKQGMTAIMGPTGSGKSSFMDILASRKEPEGVTGHVLLDGNRLPPNFKCMVGYVVQDDTLMGTLTIRENIQFSAALRLPMSVKAAERNQRVVDVISELGMEKCADTKVGNEFIRGVSGGERKRCNIGMELVISPPVLFLDEPTTGLDADTAFTVLSFLKRLSLRGRTIIFSIHQPRYSIFSLFDNLILLAGGSTVYNGPCSEVLDFFDSQGFWCELHNNPPDFFMDVVNGHQLPAVNGVKTERTDAPVDETANQDIKLVVGFGQSIWNKRLQEEASAILSQYEAEAVKMSKYDKLSYATPFWRQIQVVAGRAMKNVIRDPGTCALTVGATLIFCFIIVSIFWQLKEDPVTTFKDRSGVLFFLIVNQLFFNMAAVDVFIKERSLFMHEHISGFYRVSVYFLVKIIFDILPMRTIPVIITTSIVYYAVGLNPGFDHFFMHMFSLFTLTMAGAGLCFWLCALIRVFSMAHMTLALIYIIMMLLGGFMVSLESIGPWLNWGQYLSFFKYSQAALYINEFKGRNFCDDNGTFCITGDSFLQFQQVDYEDPFEFWYNNLILLAIFVLCLILSYIQLRRMKKSKL